MSSCSLKIVSEKAQALASSLKREKQNVYIENASMSDPITGLFDEYEKETFGSS